MAFRWRFQIGRHRRSPWSDLDNPRNDQLINVAEQFTVTSRTATYILLEGAGTPVVETRSLTVIGSGTLCTPLGGTNQVVIGSDGAGGAYFFFLKADIPSVLLETVDQTLNTTLTLDSIGQDFAPNMQISFPRGTMWEAPRSARDRRHPAGRSGSHICSSAPSSRVPNSSKARLAWS